MRPPIRRAEAVTELFSLRENTIAKEPGSSCQKWLRPLRKRIIFRKSLAAVQKKAKHPIRQS
jgi:hypothetical protein